MTVHKTLIKRLLAGEVRGMHRPSTDGHARVDTHAAPAGLIVMGEGTTWAACRQLFETASIREGCGYARGLRARKSVTILKEMHVVALFVSEGEADRWVKAQIPEVDKRETFMSLHGIGHKGGPTGWHKGVAKSYAAMEAKRCK